MAFLYVIYYIFYNFYCQTLMTDTLKPLNTKWPWLFRQDLTVLVWGNVAVRKCWKNCTRRSKWNYVTIMHKDFSHFDPCSYLNSFVPAHVLDVCRADTFTDSFYSWSAFSISDHFCSSFCYQGEQCRSITYPTESCRRENWCPRSSE